jgi:glycosyltransferase involved in cell wall biosynthesis
MNVPRRIDWEVVVVDNGSTDDTPGVLKSFAGRLPLRNVVETRRGHSPARNRAVDTANGDYLLWTDDDVIVEPGWLAAYADAFARWPQAAVFGGPIRARFDPPPPKWLLRADLLGGPVNWIFAIDLLITLSRWPTPHRQR